MSMFNQKSSIHNLPSIDQLGCRICLIGPSNSGKSTLAASLTKKLGFKCYHLDQIAHIPNSNWQRKSNQDLTQAHQQIINQDCWIIDGNYSITMPARFTRATSVIWIDANLTGAIWRYIWRSIKNDPARPGRLKGATREFNIGLIKYTLVNYPKNKITYKKFLSAQPNLPVITFSSLRELKYAYRYWDLQRP